MKAIFSLRKHSYLKIIGTFLIAIALIAGVAGCEGEAEYDLTMAVNPAGGGTATDLTGTSPYTEGTVVNITAVPADCYRFVDWTAPAGTFGDANAATTTFTMPARDVTVTANFELTPPDHFKFYDVDYETAPSVDKEVVLVDQFGTFEAVVGDAVLFGNPVEKDHPGTPLTPIADDNRHYTLYDLEYNYDEDSVYRSVEVSNQFGEKVELTVWGPVMLGVPTQKLEADLEAPECLNHYLVYEVYETDFEPVDVILKDQFIPDGEDARVWGPLYFANPVEKTVVESGDVAEIEDADNHWVLYDIEDIEPTSIEKTIQIANQFGDDQILKLTDRDTLAVPSQKIVPPTPPLDHFKCYLTLPKEPLALPMNVWDQFHEDYLFTWVMDPMMFCNPVDKVHGTVTTSSNPDNHLTVYRLHGETVKDYWTVTVDNQFNDAAVPQTLLVWGPVALAVPTQKLVPGDHGMPKYLDHYLLYEVIEGLNVTATVDLDDQFSGTAPGVEVTEPVYFANPALKGYVDLGPEMGMWDPDEHLVFYRISDNDESYGDDVGFRNQFCPEGPCFVDLIEEDQLLAVPSVKVDWAPAGPLP
jgi:hypothetical protein